VLYHFPGSNCSRKARIALAELGLSYRSRVVLIAAPELEQYHPSYVRLNPELVVPTLVDFSEISGSGQVVCNSLVILLYLARKYGDTACKSGRRPRVVPSDPEKQAVMQYWLDKQDKLPMPVLTFGAKTPGEGQQWKDKSLQAKLDKLDALLDKHSNDPYVVAQYQRKRTNVREFRDAIGDADRYSRALASTEKVLDELESVLARGGPFITGSQYTIADVAWTAPLHRFDEVGLSHRLWKGGKRPHVERYIDALRERPSFAREEDAGYGQGAGRQKKSKL